MGTAVAPHAVVDAGNPFFPVLGNDVRLLMFVTAIASVALVIAALMAGRACRIVVTVKNEEPAVIECRGLPRRRLVAG